MCMCGCGAAASPDGGQRAREYSARSSGAFCKAVGDPVGPKGQPCRQRGLLAIPHCPVYREEGRATAQDGLRGGRPSDGPRAGPAQGATSAGSRGSRRQLAEQCSCSRVAPTGPLAAEDPSFRLLLEENTFQALAQEPLLKRPRTVEDVLSVAGGNLLCLPFPKKLWRLVNSSRFTSIWWEKDGTSIGLNEELFQKEILEQDGPDKVFETDCTKSFIRQLNLYGFSQLDQDVHTSVCLSSYFTRGVGLGAVRVLSKLQFYSSPLFRKDCPHLLKKRRVGVKVAQRQEEDKAEGLGSPAEADPASGHQRSSCPCGAPAGAATGAGRRPGASLTLCPGQEQVCPSRPGQE
ncbi:heat shock transcription factor, X-linked-like [Vulpes vulpes]|uniref:Heat shock transcription factor, X-linked-like n=1 Tax=Vulpes vulpes TaxID=9627 RepID=A0ABM4ZAQ2_VULVU